MISTLHFSISLGAATLSVLILLLRDALVIIQVVGEEEERVGSGGVSRCSLIVLSVCSASNTDPPQLCADGAVSSVMDMK